MMLILANVLFNLITDWRNCLAILGGATAGFLIVGVLTNAGTKAVGVKVIPNFVLNVLRVLGAIVGGWVVALIVLGAGGGATGGAGGFGFGEASKGAVISPKKDEVVVEKDKLKDLAQKNPEVSEGRYLYIEVLMNEEIKDALGKELGPKAVDDKRFYRELKSLPTALLTLQEVRDKLSTSQPPYKKLYVVLGKQRSDPKVPRVSDLEGAARALKIPSDRTSP